MEKKRVAVCLVCVVCLATCLTVSAKERNGVVHNI